MTDREWLEEQMRREEKRDQALMEAMTQMASRLNDMAIRLDVQTNSTSEIMDSLLYALSGKRCTIIMKSGKRMDSLTLKAFDKSTLLCCGYFNVGLMDPVYRELAIDRRDVSVVSDCVDQSAIDGRIRRIKEVYDPTA